MKQLIYHTLVLLCIGYLIYLYKDKLGNKKLNSLERFKNKYKQGNNSLRRLKDGVADKLMNDPEKDIKIGNWDSEQELREKADIHRTRLKKYGRSKMNGVTLLMGKDGRVYKYSPSGEKNYL